MELQDPFEVVTPTLDGPVLATLAVADTSFTVGQLNRMLPASREGLRKVLRRLVAQGIVTHQLHGHVASYRLNRQHLIADQIVAIAHARGTFLERLGQEMTGWSTPPLYAAVFGSAGRGRMSRDSDIDVFVVRPDSVDVSTWDTQVQDLSGRILLWTGNDARFLVYEPSELVGAPTWSVVSDVLEEGLTVVGSRAWLAAVTKGQRG